jgi:hypothetical protein
VGICGRVRWDCLNGLVRVPFVCVTSREFEIGVLGDFLHELVVELSLRRYIVLDQKISGVNVRSVATCSVLLACALKKGNVRIWHILHILRGGADCVEGFKEGFSICCRSIVGKRPAKNRLLLVSCPGLRRTEFFVTYLGVTDGKIYGNDASLEAHQNRRCAVIFGVEIIQRLKDSLQFIPSPDIRMVMPCLGRLWIDLGSVARHNTKVVTSSFQGPEQICIACCVNSNLITVRQDEVEVHNAICNESMKTLKTPMATAKT